MKKRFLIIACLMIGVFIFQTNAITFKMASLLPEGTEWHRALLEMTSNWQEITDGRVKIKIYPGGIAGGEADIVRKMRIGQIDMAILSAVGMTTILPDSFAMSLPFLIENEEELDFIVEEVAPVFDEDFLDKGFIVLAWSKSGWVKFLSKDKIINPDDLLGKKFAGPVTQPELSEAFRDMGFNVISIDLPDTLMALQSDMVEAMYSVPMIAASFQWFGIADNMLDMKISPVMGGIIISKKAWKRIPDKYKEALIKETEITAAHFYKEALSIEKKAVEVMLKNGLIINQPEKNTRALWRELLGDDYEVIVGDDKFVSNESYQKVSSMLKEFRSR